MACIDDEWESFLSEGSIILSNEKSSAKNNIKKSYSMCDKLSDTANNIVDTRPAKGVGVGVGDGTGTGTKKLTRESGSESTKKNLVNTTKKCRKGSGSLLKSHGFCSDEESDSELGLDGVGGVGGVDGIEDEDNVEGILARPDMQNTKPVCSDIYISTKTKISYLNTPIDIKKVFWSIPISPYSTPQECVIKKQIKVSTTDPNELKEIKELLKNEKYYHEQEIEHIDNPEGRIKFKVQMKINIGLCKKDILNYRCKLKRAFFNCFVLIMRVKEPSSDVFKEMHVKVFNTGKLEIPGIQSDESLTHVLNLLIDILKPIVGDSIGYIPDKCETVLINSNFNCGYFINRDKLFNILKYKYRIHSNYDSCSYPGIQCKFYYVPELGEENQTGQKPNPSSSETINEISFMIFRTGSVLIVGRCGENVLYCIYNFLKKLLETEYPEIGNQLNIPEPKKHNTKLRKKTIHVLEE